MARNDKRVKTVAPSESHPFDGMAKQFKELQAKLDKQVQFWRGLMVLDHWDFQVQYHAQRSLDEFLQDAKASISVDPVYQMVLLRFWLPNCLDLTDDDIEQTVIHELCHCYVNVLFNGKESNRDKIESVVVNMTRTIQRAKNISGKSS